MMAWLWIFPTTFGVFSIIWAARQAIHGHSSADSEKLAIGWFILAALLGR